MNTVVNMYPDLKLLDESRLERDRELRLRQQSRAARAARRAQRPSRFAALAARLRRALQPDPCPPLAEDC